MNDAAFVGRGQTGTDLPRDFRGLVWRNPTNPADHRSKIFAINILHGQEESSVGFADVEHAADVGMRNLPGRAYFSVKPRERRGILGKRIGKKL